MNPEAGEIKQAAHSWLDKLSDDELVAVAPILHSLSSLLSISLARTPAPDRPAPIQELSCKVSNSFLALERQLEQAIALEEVQALRENVSACLDLVRYNKTKVGHGGGRLPALIAEEALPPEASVAPPSMTDALTGLPARLMFERVVTSTIAEGKEATIALFKVERLPYINKRFGRVTGDEIVLFVAQYLAEKLPNSSLFVRWSGPAFAAILTGKAASKEAVIELRAISRKQLSKSIDVDGRPVMLPISCSCFVEPILSTSSPDKLFAKMDDFLLAHVGL
jgi:diguanylate cyclase (GGDEF)-like protein